MSHSYCTLIIKGPSFYIAPTARAWNRNRFASRLVIYTDASGRTRLYLYLEKRNLIALHQFQFCCDKCIAMLPLLGFRQLSNVALRRRCWQTLSGVNYGLESDSRARGLTSIAEATRVGFIGTGAMVS